LSFTEKVAIVAIASTTLPTTDFPAISVVVPNFNGGRHLEAALRSLIDQNYPNLEIVVVDGGSSDHSVEIIQRYVSHIRWWVSEKDSGQADAINKGFAHCTGEIVNWLNSDDMLCPGALAAVARAFTQGTEADVVVGKCRLIFEDTGWSHPHGPTAGDLKLMPAFNPIGQPSCFYRRRLLDRHPPLDPAYHYIMDFELWLYFRERGARWKIITDELSIFPMHGDNKTLTGGDKRDAEVLRLYRDYVHELIPLTFWFIHMLRPLRKLRTTGPWWAKKLAGCLEPLANWALTPFYGYWRVRVMTW
jgi:glycosyltransferase involved in cell wall biosynthesis